MALREIASFLQVSVGCVSAWFAALVVTAIPFANQPRAGFALFVAKFVQEIGRDYPLDPLAKVLV